MVWFLIKVLYILRKLILSKIGHFWTMYPNVSKKDTMYHFCPKCPNFGQLFFLLEKKVVVTKYIMYLIKSLHNRLKHVFHFF